MFGYSGRVDYLRPIGFYDLLENTRQPAEQIFDSMRGAPRALLRYAAPFVLNNERPGLAPLYGFFRKKDYAPSTEKPAVTASAKGSAPCGGSRGCGGIGGVVSAFKSALHPFCQPTPPAYRRNECFAGIPYEKRCING